MERAREDDANEDDEDRAAGCLPMMLAVVVCTQETLTLEQVREGCKSLFEKGRAEGSK